MTTPVHRFRLLRAGPYFRNEAEEGPGSDWAIIGMRAWSAGYEGLMQGLNDYFNVLCRDEIKRAVR